MAWDCPSTDSHCTALLVLQVPNLGSKQTLLWRAHAEALVCFANCSATVLMSAPPTTGTARTLSKCSVLPPVVPALVSSMVAVLCLHRGGMARPATCQGWLPIARLPGSCLVFLAQVGLSTSIAYQRSPIMSCRRVHFLIQQSNCNYVVFTR